MVHRAKSLEVEVWAEQCAAQFNNALAAHLAHPQPAMCCCACQAPRCHPARWCHHSRHEAASNGRPPPRVYAHGVQTGKRQLHCPASGANNSRQRSSRRRQCRCTVMLCNYAPCSAVGPVASAAPATPCTTAGWCMRVLCYAWLHPAHLCCAALSPLPGLQVQAPHVRQVGTVSIEATMHKQLVPYQRCCMAAAVRRPRACRPVQHSAAQGGDTIQSCASRTCQTRYVDTVAWLQAACGWRPLDCSLHTMLN